jgi:hypothetical protein
MLIVRWSLSVRYPLPRLAVPMITPDCLDLSELGRFGWVAERHSGSVIEPAKDATMQPIPSTHRGASARSLHSPPGAPTRPPLRFQPTGQPVYRWERLREDQRQRAWGMVEEMRATVARERHRRRRRELGYALLIVLVVAVDVGLLYLVLYGITL